MAAVGQECIDTHGYGMKPASKLNGWLKLIAIVLGVISFFVVLGPVGLNLPLYKPIAQYIEQNDINANAYYYTEVEEFADADFHMRNFVVRQLDKD